MKTQIKFLLFLLIGIKSYANTGTTQVVRGRVIDEQTLQPVLGVNIVIADSDPIIGTITDLEGYFRFDHIPVGRTTIRFSHLTYEEVLYSNLVVDAGKEVVLNVKMKESFHVMNDIVIRATNGENYEVVNEMATVSARGFNVEETMRYAGSRNDPARMATNFAGVSGANDARNDIIIRGNSPTGLLWRLEGLNIPNPNHFAAVGTTGGPVSILNNNLLAESEFFTGAFPSMYGNALSGVFDLRMRNGNSEKREYLAQIGFNGLELGAEGPFKKGSRSSYLAHYRYSVPALMQELNVNTGTGEAVPYYQDLSFKLNLVVPKGQVDIFGIGGKSHIDLLGSETSLDEVGDNLYNGSDIDIYNTSRTAVGGVSYLRFLGKDTYLKNMAAISATSFGAALDTVFRDENFEVVEVRDYVNNQVDESKISWSSVLHHKMNNRNLLETGILVDFIDAKMLREIQYISEGTSYLNTIDYSGNTTLFQGHVSWQHRFTESLILNTGLHYQNLFLNNASQALEPRIGLQYRLSHGGFLSFGYGRHNQTQPSTVYFVETRMENGDKILTNKGLGFSSSDHIVLSWKKMITPSLKFVAESYYQHLTNIPVERSPSSFSSLNYGADFGVPDTDSLVNEGTGKNYGVEITMEKYFNKSWYFLMTGSLFNSLYTASDDMERNTAFNGNYVFNGLFGKEWSLGKKGHALVFDLKFTQAGSRRFIPIDLEASREAGFTVYDYTTAYENRYPDYLRADVKVTFRMQSKKLTQEWIIDIQNVTNHKNVFYERYDPFTREIATTYQMGMWPMIQYRILF